MYTNHADDYIFDYERKLKGLWNCGFRWHRKDRCSIVLFNVHVCWVLSMCITCIAFAISVYVERAQGTLDWFQCFFFFVDRYSSVSQACVSSASTSAIRLFPTANDLFPPVRVFLKKRKKAKIKRHKVREMTKERIRWCCYHLECQKICTFNWSFPKPIPPPLTPLSPVSSPSPLFLPTCLIFPGPFPLWTQLLTHFSDLFSCYWVRMETHAWFLLVWSSPVLKFTTKSLYTSSKIIITVLTTLIFQATYTSLYT